MLDRLPPDSFGNETLPSSCQMTTRIKSRQKAKCFQLKVEQDTTDISALLDSKLSSLSTDSDVEKDWTSFKAIVPDAALQTLVHATRTH